MIARQMGLLEMLEAMMTRNRQKGASPKYLEFLAAVYTNAYRDEGFRSAVETCLLFSGSVFCTIEQAEKMLAGMDGGLRPLFEDRGIVEPVK